MKTPMVLFSARYSDAIQPHVHYIPLERDFSNVDEVLAKLDNLPDLEAMVDRAYDHLVGSGKFGYRAYIARLSAIIEHEMTRRGARAAPKAKPQSTHPDAFSWL